MTWHRSSVRRRATDVLCVCACVCDCMQVSGGAVDEVRLCVCACSRGAGFCARYGDVCIPNARMKFAQCCEALKCSCSSGGRCPTCPSICACVQLLERPVPDRTRQEVSVQERRTPRTLRLQSRPIYTALQTAWRQLTQRNVSTSSLTDSVTPDQPYGLYTTLTLT